MDKSHIPVESWPVNILKGAEKQSLANHLSKDCVYEPPSCTGNANPGRSHRRLSTPLFPPITSFQEVLGPTIDHFASLHCVTYARVESLLHVLYQLSYIQLKLLAPSTEHSLSTDLCLWCWWSFCVSAGASFQQHQGETKAGAAGASALTEDKSLIPPALLHLMHSAFFFPQLATPFPAFYIRPLSSDSLLPSGLPKGDCAYIKS